MESVIKELMFHQSKYDKYLSLPSRKLSTSHQQLEVPINNTLKVKEITELQTIYFPKQKDCTTNIFSNEMIKELIINSHVALNRSKDYNRRKCFTGNKKILDSSSNKIEYSKITHSKCKDRKENICTLPKVTPLPFIKTGPKLRLIRKGKPISKSITDSIDNYKEKIINTSSLQSSLNISAILLGRANNKYIPKNKALNMSKDEHKKLNIIKVLDIKHFNSCINFPQIKRPKTKLSTLV